MQDQGFNYGKVCAIIENYFNFYQKKKSTWKKGANLHSMLLPMLFSQPLF